MHLKSPKIGFCVIFCAQIKCSYLKTHPFGVLVRGFLDLKGGGAVQAKSFGLKLSLLELYFWWFVFVVLVCFG